jgi:nicotinamidase-related amidase
LVIDMHAKDMAIASDTDMGKKRPDIMEYWNNRISQTVLPNSERLIDGFRRGNLRVVYTRNGNVTSTGDEMTNRLRQRTKRRGSGFMHPRKTPGHEIDSRLTPGDEDLIVDKLTSGAFNSSILDHALRNMGITTVVVTGILTDMCVLGTARTAAEIGYNTLICEDACATYTQRAHDEALLMHARVFGRVATTEDVLAEI